MEKIDVIIPCIENDINILKLCLISLKTFILDNIENIYIISPNNDNIKNICKINNLIFIDETTIIDNIYYIQTRFKNTNYGWLIQQLIKLSGKIGTCNNFIALDADHIFINNHKFLNDNNTFNIYYETEYNKPYFRNLYDISNGKYTKKFKYSFISDAMIFNKKYLNDFKQEIELLNNNNFENILINNFHKYSNNDISEFEFYGTYMIYNHPDMLNFIPAKRNMLYNKIEQLSFQKILNLYNKNYNSLTQHKNAK